MLCRLVYTCSVIKCLFSWLMIKTSVESVLGGNDIGTKGSRETLFFKAVYYKKREDLERGLMPPILIDGIVRFLVDRPID